MICFSPSEVVIVFDGSIAVGGCYREGSLQSRGKEKYLKTFNVTLQSLKEKKKPGDKVDKEDLFGPMIFLAFTQDDIKSVDVLIETLTKLKEKMKEGINEQTTSI